MAKNKISGWMVVFVILYSLILFVDFWSLVMLMVSSFSRGWFSSFTPEIYIQFTAILFRLAFSIVFIVKIFRIMWQRSTNGQLVIVRLLKLIFIVECIYQLALFLTSQFIGNQELGLIHILPKILGYWLRYFIWKLYFEKSTKASQYFHNIDAPPIVL